MQIKCPKGTGGGESIFDNERHKELTPFGFSLLKRRFKKQLDLHPNFISNTEYGNKHSLNLVNLSNTYIQVAIHPTAAFKQMLNPPIEANET